MHHGVTMIPSKSWTRKTSLIPCGSSPAALISSHLIPFPSSTTLDTILALKPQNDAHRTTIITAPRPNRNCLPARPERRATFTHLNKYSENSIRFFSTLNYILHVQFHRFYYHRPCLPWRSHCHRSALQARQVAPANLYMFVITPLKVGPS